jgi:NADH-quinone oxidoreductase subunit G
MPKFTLDEKEIEFKPGQTIIEAAADAGITIPHFCWHESLSVSGNCRVCLVDIEKMPKLAIACSTQAAEGMVVHTANEKTLAARNSVMEFLLINHPLDCPICDEAGECKLQDYAYKHSKGESRFTEQKQHKDKRVPLGPHVMFDGERCISCSRCIRFCDEIAGEKQLTFTQRGDRVTITTFPGKELDNPYSMNVVDICPVGALTNRDFRFQSRVWDMSSTKTICSGCSRGCNIDMWVRENEIQRLTPRLNKDVNSFWMCDDGRLHTFKHVNAENRVNGPHLRRNGEMTKVTWDEACAGAVSELKVFGKDEVAVFASAFSTCEDNYLLNRFAKNTISTKYIDYQRIVEKGSGDDLLKREDKMPNALGAEIVGINKYQDGEFVPEVLEGIKSGKIKALVIVGNDIFSMYPALREVAAKLDLIIVFAVNENTTTKYAHILFPLSSYAEQNGTWVNFQGRLQRIRPAIAIVDRDRSLDHMAVSRLDKFGTEFDRWGKSKKIDARSVGKVVLGMQIAFGHKSKITTADEIFHELAQQNPVFKGLDYDAIGESGVQLKITK